METMVDGVTGRFFDEQTPAALVDVLRDFDPDAYDPAVMRAHVTEFDVPVFQQRLRQFVETSAQRYREEMAGGTGVRVAALRRTFNAYPRE